MCLDNYEAACLRAPAPPWAARPARLALLPCQPKTEPAELTWEAPRDVRATRGHLCQTSETGRAPFRTTAITPASQQSKASLTFFADGGSCLQCVQNAASVKGNKSKGNKMRPAEQFWGYMHVGRLYGLPLAPAVRTNDCSPSGSSEMIKLQDR